MIFGSVTVDREAVSTHRDSYLLKSLTVVSVRRPLLGPALVFAGGFGAFGFAFADLMYADELAVLYGLVGLALLTGLWLGQLKLLSRDLRNSELSGVIYGGFAHLNRTRREIVACLHQASVEQGQ